MVSTNLIGREIQYNAHHVNTFPRFEERGIALRGKITTVLDHESRCAFLVEAESEGRIVWSRIMPSEILTIYPSSANSGDAATRKDAEG